MRFFKIPKSQSDIIALLIDLNNEIEELKATKANMPSKETLKALENNLLSLNK